MTAAKAIRKKCIAPYKIADSHAALRFGRLCVSARALVRLSLPLYKCSAQICYDNKHERTHTVPRCRAKFHIDRGNRRSTRTPAKHDFCLD